MLTEPKVGNAEMTILECEGYWLCMGRGLEGTGATPNDAYENHKFRNE